MKGLILLFFMGHLLQYVVLGIGLFFMAVGAIGNAKAKNKKTKNVARGVAVGGFSLFILFVVFQILKLQGLI